MVTASEMNRLRRPVAPAVRLLDSHSSTPLGASPPGPPVASPILAGSTTSPQMCRRRRGAVPEAKTQGVGLRGGQASRAGGDRKSTRLNSSHSQISYAVFCLKKKKRLPTTSHKLHTTPTTPCATLLGA